MDDHGDPGWLAFLWQIMDRPYFGGLFIYRWCLLRSIIDEMLPMRTTHVRRNALYFLVWYWVQSDAPEQSCALSVDTEGVAWKRIELSGSSFCGISRRLSRSKSRSKLTGRAWSPGIRKIVGGSGMICQPSYKRQIARLTRTNVLIWRFSSPPVKESFRCSPRHRGRGSTTVLWISMPLWKIRKGRWTEIASSVITINIMPAWPHSDFPPEWIYRRAASIFGSALQCLFSGGMPAGESKVLSYGHKSRSLEWIRITSRTTYRPLSNLTFLSKVIEKLVVRQLLQNLESCNFTQKLQSGYKLRKGHSTETVLLRLHLNTYIRSSHLLLLCLFHFPFAYFHICLLTPSYRFFSCLSMNHTRLGKLHINSLN